jgi:hypothetical protein
VLQPLYRFGPIPRGEAWKGGPLTLSTLGPEFVKACGGVPWKAWGLWDPLGLMAWGFELGTMPQKYHWALGRFHQSPKGRGMQVAPKPKPLGFGHVKGVGWVPGKPLEALGLIRLKQVSPTHGPSVCVVSTKCTLDTGFFEPWPHLQPHVWYGRSVVGTLMPWARVW